MTGPEAPDRTEVAAPSARRRPGLGAVGAWAAFCGGALLLMGPWGAVAPVLVAAVVLADLPRRWIGAVGVACTAAVPVAVLAVGIPSESELSPAFVSESLVPHHLMATGLLLVGAWAVLDLHRAVAAGGFVRPAEEPPDEPPRARLAAVLLVVAVALLALGASWAVLAG